MLHARRLIYLNEIAKCGSIRKAAENLNVASSAINRQIIALEEDIGIPIFERLPRGLRLTAAGELYIEHVRETLKNYSKLKSRVSGLKTPYTGRFTMVSTVGLTSGPLPEIIAAFLESHPRVQVFLRTDSGTTTVAPVLSGEVDLGLGFNIPATPGLRVIANFDVPLGVVMRPRHRFAVKTSIQVADLAQERLYLAQLGTSLRQFIDLALSPLTIPIVPVLESSSIDMLKRLVQIGTGVTLLNALDVIDECKRGMLVFRPLSDAHIKLQSLRLFGRTRAPLDTVTSLFVEFLVEELNQLLHKKTEKTVPSETVTATI